jgi:phospholipid/cholesterol/gamma-HCH transport system permease protein
MRRIEIRRALSRASAGAILARDVCPGGAPAHRRANTMRRPDAKIVDVPERISIIDRIDHSAGSRLSLAGKLTFLEAKVIWDDVRRRIDDLKADDRIDFDMGAVEAIDGGTMALLVHLRSDLAARGVRADFVNAKDDVQELIHLYRGDMKPVRRKKRKPEGMLAQIGRATLELVLEIQRVLGFFGDTVLATLGILKEPKTGNWKEVLPTMERSGADAVPIVILINFLVGFVMAFQGANQLKQFGANIFVADLVGLSVTRELGPLMTAIILCGRSGAAFAAELGSMKVSEEIDALRTMGFGPIRYLVLPKAMALMLVLPLLTLIGDFVGMLGGMVVGLTSLGLTVSGYVNETQKALSMWDVFSGLVKSVVFALAITLIACQQGFATTGGAEGVGRRTTSSVVSILFTLILIDAGFTAFFHEFHL